MTVYSVSLVYTQANPFALPCVIRYNKSKRKLFHVKHSVSLFEVTNHDKCRTPGFSSGKVRLSLLLRSYIGGLVLAKIIAIANQKGGVGKTTTTVNLSAALALAGCRVLMVDIDPQGNATSGVGVDKRDVEPGQSAYGLLVGEHPVADMVRPTMLDKLFLLPSSIQLAGAEVELVNVMNRENALKRRLAEVVEDYDFVLIDCPPSLGLITINALTAAHATLIPIQCEFYALEGLSQLISTIQLVKRYLNPDLGIEGVALTMYDGRTNLSEQVVADVRAHFKEKVYNTIIPRNVRLGEAPSHGLPIMLYDSKCLGAVTYQELAQEVLQRNREPGRMQA